MKCIIISSQQIRSPENVSGYLKVTQLVSGREGIRATSYQVSEPVFPPPLFFPITLKALRWIGMSHFPTSNASRTHTISEAQNSDPFFAVEQFSDVTIVCVSVLSTHDMPGLCCTFAYQLPRNLTQPLQLACVAGHVVSMGSEGIGGSVS